VPSRTAALAEFDNGERPIASAGWGRPAAGSLESDVLSSTPWSPHAVALDVSAAEGGEIVTPAREGVIAHEDHGLSQKLRDGHLSDSRRSPCPIELVLQQWGSDSVESAYRFEGEAAIGRMLSGMAGVATFMASPRGVE